MKPAKWMKEPITGVGNRQQTVGQLAKALLVESTAWRKDGWPREAKVIAQMAEALERIAKGQSPAKAFDWREAAQANASETGEG